MLVEGLKRRPAHSSATEALIEFYTEGVGSPGLEHDVVSALDRTPDAGRSIDRVYQRLIEVDAGSMVSDFERAAREAGYEVAEPAPPVEKGTREDARASEPTPESEPDPEEEPRPHTREADDEPQPDPPKPESKQSKPARDAPPEPEDETPADEPTTDERSSEPGLPYRRFVVGLIVLAALCGAGYYAWTWIGPVRAELVLDGHLRELDPSRTSELDKAVEWGRESGLSKSALRERRDFVEAIRSIEHRKAFGMDYDPTTTWGLSAKALAALTRDDVETAVRASTKLDRAADPNQLARMWTRARVAEYRGRIGVAQGLYRRARKQFPNFIPFLTGSIRLAFYRLDESVFDRRLQELLSASPDHPYGALTHVEFPRFASSSDSETGSPLEDMEDADSAFIQLIGKYLLAVEALEAGRYGHVVGLTSQIVEQQRDCGPALWVRAAARAALFSVEKADADYGRIVELPGLSREFQSRLQYIAPSVLTRAGRPDLGAKYIKPGLGAISVQPSGKGAVEDTKSVVSRASKYDNASGGDISEQLKRRVELARIRVMLELGHLTRATSLVDELPASRESTRLALLRAELDVRGGRRIAGPSDWARDSASTVERIVDAYYAGNFEEAIERGEALLEKETDVWAVRLVALSYAATDRGRRALKTLEQLEDDVVAAPQVERVRSRILARLATGNASAGSSEDRFEQVEPTSVTGAVDMAAIMLWKHRIEDAEHWSGSALARCSEFPEANWFEGLVLRLQGKESKARRYLRRSWRADSESGRLALELGYVNLAIENYEHARDLFYRALLANSASLEAIRGLGRAYHGFSDREGKWNFERILKNYDDRASRTIHAAEVLRWLGVFYGTRSGNDAGKKYLDRAMEKAGRRPFVLLELARYHEARGDREAARRLYVDALEKDSTLADAHLGLARVAKAAKNRRMLRTHLRRYLDLQPAGEHAHWARTTLSSLEAD